MFATRVLCARRLSIEAEYGEFRLGTGYLCAKDKSKGLWPVGIANKRPILERKEMRYPLQDRGRL